MFSTREYSYDISFVMLSWNSERFLAKSFDSIIHKCLQENITYEVIVIDNGSTDKSAHIVKEYATKYPGGYKLIDLPENKGTTYSRNLGLKQSQGKNLCIIDSDTELGKGSLRDILQFLATNTHIGLLCPKLVLPDGSIQNSVKLFPTMLDKLIKIPRIVFGVKTRNYDFYADFNFNKRQPVDSAISACWFFRQDLIETVGYLDERIFYSPEDLDYSLRTWKSGYKNFYYPDFTVYHHTQQITHRKPFSKTSRSHFFGLLYYYNKHGGWIIRQKFADT